MHGCKILTEVISAIKIELGDERHHLFLVGNHSDVNVNPLADIFYCLSDTALFMSLKKSFSKLVVAAALSAVVRSI